MLGDKFIRCVHASPRSVHERISPFQPLEKQETIFENSDQTMNLCGNRTPDYFIYGDIHYACVKPLDGKGILVNVGSVGNPLDIPEASYGIVEQVGNSVSVQLVRVPYDREAVLRKARAVGLPDYEVFEAEIMECIYRGSQKKKVEAKTP
jgi:protein phosphatase